MSEDAAAPPSAALDVSPHHLFQSGEVLKLFERLRREDPVHYCPHSAYGPYWSLTRYEDILAVDNNHKVFSSSFEHGGIVLAEDQMRPPVEGFVMSSFIGLDEPLHTPYRKSVQPIVSAAALAQFSELVKARTARVLDELPLGEEFDWVERVSVELTTQMLATLFDFPFEERRKLKMWSDVTTTLEGMDGFVSHEYRVAQLLECLEVFTRLWNDRVNAPPRFDLVSMLAQSPSTRGMTPMDYLSQVLMLIVGGNDTTRNTMSASVYGMNLFPDEFRKLRERPELIDNMVKEVIRWQTPIAHQRRTALEDCRIRDKQIRRGEKVVMWYYSGNRDEAIFPEGEQIRFERENLNRHLSFGFGIHRCLGMRIAELQLRILWQEILRRYGTIELVGVPQRTKSNQVNGYTSMRVRLRPLRH
jgi:cytochrome P450